MKQKITGADYPGENIHYLNRIQLMISILYIYIFLPKWLVAFET